MESIVIVTCIDLQQSLWQGGVLPVDSRPWLGIAVAVANQTPIPANASRPCTRPAESVGVRVTGDVVE